MIDRNCLLCGTRFKSKGEDVCQPCTRDMVEILDDGLTEQPEDGDECDAI
jgi:hypothetical protein